MDKIRCEPNELLLDNGTFPLLSSSRTEEIVKDESLQDDELTVLLILQAWSNVNRERQSIAAKLTNHHVSLELIDSENLARTVEVDRSGDK
jgi:hypothetical protein